MLIRELIALLSEQDPEAAILVGYEGICKAVGSVTEAWTGSGAVRPPFVLTADEDTWWEDTMEMLPGPPPPTEEELRAKLIEDIDEWNALLQKAREAGDLPEYKPIQFVGNDGQEVNPEDTDVVSQKILEFISMHDSFYFYSVPLWARALDRSDQSRAMSLSAPLLDRCRQLGVEPPAMET